MDMLFPEETFRIISQSFAYPLYSDSTHSCGCEAEGAYGKLMFKNLEMPKKAKFIHHIIYFTQRSEFMLVDIQLWNYNLETKTSYFLESQNVTVAIRTDQNNTSLLTNLFRPNQGITKKWIDSWITISSYPTLGYRLRLHKTQVCNAAITLNMWLQMYNTRHILIFSTGTLRVGARLCIQQPPMSAKGCSGTSTVALSIKVIEVFEEPLYSRLSR